MCATNPSGTLHSPDHRWGCYDYEVIEREAMALIPGFTFNEETELVSSLYSAVAFYKHYAETSPNNGEYWRQRAETVQQVADKFYAACQNAIYNL